MGTWSDEDIANLFGRQGTFEPGEPLGKDYEVVGLLGRGSQAEVFKVRNKNNGQFYAAKVFVGDEGNRRFEVEQSVFGEIEAKLDDEKPFLAHGHPPTNEQGQKVLVMQHLEGESLGERLKEKRPFSPKEAARTVRQVLKGLAGLHRIGWIHRDVKPANVRMDGKGRPVLLDFGVACKSASDKEPPYSGTPGYSPPEKEVGPGWDVFSAGVLLHELATGRRPVWEKGGSVPTKGDSLVPPQELAFHPRLVYCLRKALDPDPKRRFRDAGEFGGAMSLVKWPLMTAGNVWVWAKGHRALAAACAAIVLLGLVGHVWRVQSFQNHFAETLFGVQGDYEHRIDELKKAGEGKSRRIAELEARLGPLVGGQAWNEFQEKLEEVERNWGLNIDVQIEELNRFRERIDDSDWPTDAKALVREEVGVEIQRFERQREDLERWALPVKIRGIWLQVPEERAGDDVLSVRIAIAGADPEEIDFTLKRSAENPREYIADEERVFQHWRSQADVRVSVWRPRRRWEVRSTKIIETHEHWSIRLFQFQPPQGGFSPLHAGFQMRIEGRILEQPR